LSHKATDAFENRRGGRGEVKKATEHEAQSSHRRKTYQPQDAAEGTATRPEAKEIASHACEANGQQKENSKDLCLLGDRVRQPFGRDAKSQRPPSQTRRDEQTDDASEKNKLSRIGGDNGPKEFGKTLQQ